MVGLGYKPYLGVIRRPAKLHRPRKAPVLVNGLHRRALLAAVEYMYIAHQLIGEPVTAYRPVGDNGSGVTADKPENVRAVIGKNVVHFESLLLYAIVYSFRRRNGLSVEF